LSLVYMTRKLYFSAAHVYRVPSWTQEENVRVFGPCSNPNGHGHDYTLEVRVRGPVDEKSGMVVNITEVNRVVGSFLEAELDGKFLDREVPYFHTRIPTTENLVTYLWESLAEGMPGCELYGIRLRENPYLYSEKERGSMIKLTRKYHFCTAHRLHAAQLSDEENVRLFGKCNNPHGHGHNYYLEVTVAGSPDPVTGMIINLTDLDAAVNEQIIKRFDHKNLNLDTAEFRELNPTSENFVKVIWELLAPVLPGLSKIGLYETEKNYFEYSGEQQGVTIG
jgi:6-pyruvoyltetrahydropterin/6-carboxytetrahydropterin synthase